MAKAKVIDKVRTRKPLPIYGGGSLPAGVEITLTEERETIPYTASGRIIVDAEGARHLVLEEDLEYALGAH